MVQLIGHYDSPFVRRVAIAMRRMGLDFEHVAWSVFREADRIAEYSPLLRVPVLVLDDGSALTESWAIVEHLERIAPVSLWPDDESGREEALGLTALATGLGDKAVALIYEYVLREQPLQEWVDRCRRQIEATADKLDHRCARASDGFLFGVEPGHADIAIAAVWRFVNEAHAERFDVSRWPSLARLWERCEALPEFEQIRQPFFVARAPGAGQ